MFKPKFIHHPVQHIWYLGNKNIGYLDLAFAEENSQNDVQRPKEPHKKYFTSLSTHRIFQFKFFSGHENILKRRFKRM